jgi:hypothetical protein
MTSSHFSSSAFSILNLLLDSSKPLRKTARARYQDVSNFVGAVIKAELRIIQQREQSERFQEELKSGGGNVARMKLYFVLPAVLGTIALLEFFMLNSPAARIQLPPVVGTFFTFAAIPAGLLRTRKRIARIPFLTGDTENR